METEMKISSLRGMIREALLRELTIATHIENIQIEVDITKTRHASERQGRHRDRISDHDIISLAEDATSYIVEDILAGLLRADQEIVIRDMVEHLNIVCTLKPKSGSTYNLVVITVMRKRGFNPKSGSHVIDLY